jgi:methionyl-tRNA formyltransferase
MKELRDLQIAFFGTSDFSVGVLDALEAAGIVPSIVVSAPDAKRGRGLTLTPPETKVWAEERNIPVLQPHTLRLDKGNDESRDMLYNSEWDLFIVASYGKILPQELLDTPVHGTLNVHPSLLPQYRGASPIRSAILEDNPDAVGVTIMLLDAGVDTGPIVAQGRVGIERGEGWPPGALMLEQLLAKEGGALLAEVIPEWITGSITPEAQDGSKATLSKKIEKEMGLIDLTDDPYKNYLKICALEGWPGTYFFTEKNGKKIRVKVTEASYSDSALTIERVIPEGKKEMAYADFLRGA